MASEELYFRRADLYKTDDPDEGLPSDDYVRSVRGLVRYDLKDELDLNNDQASNRHFSESYFLSCWQLYEGETLAMWKRYGPVAICTRYGLLKSALNGMHDSMHLGLVRYGDGYARRYNVLEFLFNKRTKFEKEREVRAVRPTPVLIWVLRNLLIAQDLLQPASISSESVFKTQVTPGSGQV